MPPRAPTRQVRVAGCRGSPLLARWPCGESRRRGGYPLASPMHRLRQRKGLASPAAWRRPWATKCSGTERFRAQRSGSCRCSRTHVREVGATTSGGSSCPAAPAVCETLSLAKWLSLCAPCGWFHRPREKRASAKALPVSSPPTLGAFGKVQPARRTCGPKGGPRTRPLGSRRNVLRYLGAVPSRYVQPVWFVRTTPQTSRPLCHCAMATCPTCP